MWERGAGVTQGCGTGACAVAVAAVRRGLAERNVTVQFDGGELEIRWEDDGCVHMSGPTTTSFSGVFGELL